MSFGPTTGLVFDTGTSRIELHGYAWFRAQSESVVGGETDVDATVPVGRVFVTGSVLNSKLHFFAQPEFAGDEVKLLDLFADWRFSDAVHVRVGQFRTPYSRAFITPLTNLELPTRGLVIDRFGLGRDTGAMVSGDLAGTRFHYDVALVNGATINDTSGERDAPAVIVRNEIRFGEPVPYDQAPSLTLDDPHGLTIGFGGAYSRKASKTSGNTTTEELWNAAIDAAWMHGPVSLRVETFLRSAHNSPREANAFGAYSQLGVFVLPRLLELGGRAGWVSEGPDVESYEAFLAAYFREGSRTLGHHLKMIVGYRFDSGDLVSGNLRDRHLVRVQTQLFF